MAIEFPFQTNPPKLIRYPGGESTIVPELTGERAVAVLRGADADELVTVLLWAHSVRRLGGKPSLLLPYLPAARADHDDRAVGFDAAVYADLINTGGFEHVVCVDPHSEIMPSLIERCSTISAADVIEAAGLALGLAGVICPDRGARHRSQEVADRLGLPVFHAEKHRDFATGSLSGFSCEPLPATGDLLVADDICDGGGTFLGLASVIPEAAGRLHLWVSHGIFSGHAAALFDAYATVTTTDSHPGCRNIAASVVPVIDVMVDRLDQLTATTTITNATTQPGAER